MKVFKNDKLLIANVVEDYINDMTLHRIGNKQNYSYHPDLNRLKKIIKYKPKINYKKENKSKKDMKFMYEYKHIIYDSNKNDLENKYLLISKFVEDILNLNLMLIEDEEYYNLKHNNDDDDDEFK